MKSIQLEFEPGQSVEVLKNSQPMPTRIRAVRYEESLEIQRHPDTGIETEKVVGKVTYSTFADPNMSLPPSRIGKSRDDLIAKVFGSGKSADIEAKKK